MRFSFFSLLIIKTNLLLFIVLFSAEIKAQEKCGIVAYEKSRAGKSAYIENKADFENWLARKKALINNNPTQSIFELGAAEEEILTIPVVVHIIHNGEPQGTGANIPDSRVLSQIDILNQDFRRLNADTTNTPPEFISRAEDTRIEFRLARRDPEGIATNGILRVPGTKASWDIQDNNELKSLSYWPAEDYLNIWVAPLQATLLGYAQFPVSDLEGLGNSSNNSLTDGIVVTSDYLGLNENVSPVSKGRTATHEVGHFLGLRHIWGDGDCEDDDFCDDTPNASASSRGCPETKSSCGSNDMFQNYMDFTNDACMNIFTAHQKERMQIVLASSPRRASLLQSKGAEDPVVVSNDAGIRAINSPGENICSNTIIPEIEIRNYGNNPINSITIKIMIDGQEVETISKNVDLVPLELTNISFSSIKVQNPGSREITFEVVQTNGVKDNNSENDIRTSTLIIPEVSEPPVREHFAVLPADWSITNPDQDITWQIQTAPEIEQENTALFLDFFSYEGKVGEQDFFVTPSLDFSNLLLAELTFKVAYAEFSSGSNDGLLVAVSTDCGNTFEADNVIFQKFGSGLATAARTGAPFVPESRFDWRTEKVDLTKFIGENSIRIAFIGQNDFGNNLYVDDIAIETRKQFNADIGILNLSPSQIVTCNSNIQPTFAIQNMGTETVTEFDITYQIDNDIDFTTSYSGPPLMPGDTVNIELPGLPIEGSARDILITVMNPNNLADQNQIDNIGLIKVKINGSHDEIPLREKFSNKGFSGIEWLITNPDQNIGWEITETGRGDFAAFINNFNYLSTGQKDWLVSPALDLSNTTLASIFFDVSYAKSRNFDDGLEVLLSTDCGETYPHVVYSKSGKELSVVESQENWLPESDEDWRTEFIDLSEFAGTENIRVAFVANNGSGNNLYLDNIEFFTDNNPEPVQAPSGNYIAFPNPASDILNITLNLEQKETIHFEILDTKGNLLFRENYPNTLNQTFSLNTAGLNSGMYLLRVTSSTFTGIKRIIITR